MGMNKKIIIGCLFVTNVYSQEECSIIKNDNKRLECYDSYFIEKPQEVISQKILSQTNVVDEAKTDNIKLVENKSPESKPTKKINKTKEKFFLMEVINIKRSVTNKHTIYGNKISFKFQEPIKSSVKIKKGDEIRIYEGLFGFQASIGNQNRKYAIKII